MSISVMFSSVTLRSVMIVQWSLCKNKSLSIECGLSCVWCSSRILPASEKARSKDVVVAGMLRIPLTSLLNAGHAVALLLQKSTREGESPAAATHIHNVINYKMMMMIIIYFSLNCKQTNCITVSSSSMLNICFWLLSLIVNISFNIPLLTSNSCDMQVW